MRPTRSYGEGHYASARSSCGAQGAAAPARSEAEEERDEGYARRGARSDHRARARGQKRAQRLRARTAERGHVAETRPCDPVTWPKAGLVTWRKRVVACHVSRLGACTVRAGGGGGGGSAPRPRGSQ